MPPQKRRKKKKKQVSLEGWRPRSREEKLTPEQQAARDRWLMHKQELEDEVRREHAARVNYLRGEVRRFLAELDLPIREIWNGISVMADDFVFTDVELKERNASSVLNRIAAAKLVQPMLQLVKDELGGRGLPYTALPSASGIRLLRAGNQTALVKATCVDFADRAAAIQGNFLQPGESWEELRRQLRRFAVAEVRTELPSSVPAAALSQAAEATRRLRSERTLEYGHSVILREADRTVCFDPIPEHGAVEVPFAYEGTGGHLSGAIRLKAPGEVLALAIADRSENPAIIASAWLFALLGYADLTCVVLEEPTEAVALKGASGRAGGASPPLGPTRRTPPTPRTQSLGFGAPLPTSLTPTHSTRQHLASYVTGHKRHLGHGRQASLEARKRAEHIGIRLAQHETWVRPHARGVPDDAVLEFDWKAPPRIPTSPSEPEHLIA